MVDKIIGTIAMSLTGRSFVLKMDEIITSPTYKDARATFAYHLRQNQPCYGELRKYESSHPGDCTQPENGKPGDLHNPFPPGIPSALALRFMCNPNTDNDPWLKFLYSSESPWVKGFNKVEFIKNDAGNVAGMILEDLNIDPTVLVNSLKMVQHMSMRGTAFNQLVEAGLHPKEAFLLCMLCDYRNGTNGSYNTYTMPAVISVKRFMAQRPMDLSGGTLRDRVDYNRTRMQDPFFSAPGENGMVWKEILNGKFGFPTGGGNVAKDVIKPFRSFLDYCIEKEKDIVDVPYIWKTTSGKTNATGPIKKVA